MALTGLGSANDYVPVSEAAITMDYLSPPHPARGRLLFYIVIRSFVTADKERIGGTTAQRNS